MILTKSIETIFSKQQVESAIEFLRTKRNACGDDGIWLHDLEDYWDLNGEKILNEIQRGRYKPQLIHEKVIVRADGKHRSISLLSSVDRLLLRVLQQNLQEAFEKDFSKYSFAYQSGKGVIDAVKCAAAYIQSGKEYVVEIDIKDFFDNIDQEILMEILYRFIKDEKLCILLEQFIKCQIEMDFRIEKKRRGILQGSSISPVLSNLYLNEFDCWMEQQKYTFVRFADDICVYVSSMQEGNQVLDKITRKLEEYKLEINSRKQGIYPAISRYYLGYCFEKRKNEILIKKSQKKQQYLYNKWNTNTLEKIGHNYHIINNGILSRRDYTLLFENPEKKIYIPVETTNAINIYSNVEISSNVLEVLSNKRLDLNIFNKYGVYQGSFYSVNQRNRMNCLLKQVEIYQNKDKRLEYAKKMDMASIHNIRCNIRYYQKKKASSVLQDLIQILGANIKEMNESNDIDKLLLIEARARQKYYQSLNEILGDPKFCFRLRTRRPPKDEINALISFGNVYLYQKLSQIIHGTAVDIRISFVHSALKRYENLNLDIADIFKPIIVDRVIFRMINKKMISADEHFIKEKDAVLLNAEGKRIFIKELEWKMKQAVTVDGEQYTYERLLHREVHNLEQGILGNQKYKPFKYQM